MSFGAGLLLAAIGLELWHEAQKGIGVFGTASTFLVAAGLFSGVNAILAAKGAKHRKRCGDCVSHHTEEECSGSGRAIAIGTVMDALPEALVLGVTIAAGSPIGALVAALAMGNIGESLSSTAGLRDAGRSPRFIMGLWICVAVAVVVLTIIGAQLAGAAGETARPWIEAFAGGVLMAMVAEAMLPEAFHKAPRFSGLQAAAGFATYAMLLVLI